MLTTSPTNEDRAAWAAEALHGFIQRTGCDLADSLGDLLTDLMHWADRNQFDFDLALDRACGHYEAELEEGPAPVIPAIDNVPEQAVKVGTVTPSPWSTNGNTIETGAGIDLTIATVAPVGIGYAPRSEEKVRANVQFLAATHDLYDALSGIGKQFQQANLFSTATQEERDAALSRIMDHWNFACVPAIEKSKRAA